MPKKRVVHQKKKGPIDPSLGQKVRELRIARGMTQAQLAGPDFSKGFISLLETGRTRPSLRAAQILASRLGVAVIEFLGQVPPPTFIPEPELDKKTNQALERMHQVIGVASSVMRVESLIREVLRTHSFIRGKLGRLTKHFAKMPDPQQFASDDRPKFDQALAVWREQLWRIANEQPEARIKR